MQVDPLAQVGNVLRALVRNARNVIFINEQDGSVVTIGGRHFLHVDDGAVGDAANAIEPGAALAFEICRALGLAPQKRICAGGNCAAYNYNRIEAERIHTEGERRMGGELPMAFSLPAYDGSGVSGSG